MTDPAQELALALSETSLALDLGMISTKDEVEIKPSDWPKTWQQARVSQVRLLMEFSDK